MSEYYNSAGVPIHGSLIRTLNAIDDELGLVETGISDKLPVLAGNALKLVRVNSGATALDVVAASSLVTVPAGSDTQVQFNDGGAFGADVHFAWDKTNNVMTLGAQAADATIKAAAATTTNTSGGSLVLISGPGNGTGAAGDIQVYGNSGGINGNGGQAQIAGGDGGSVSGDGGEVTITGGAAVGGGIGGSITMSVGPGVGAEDGNVVMNGTGGDVATNATGGFTCIPTCAGTPTGVPANVPAGNVAMIFDRTNSKLYIYNGAWKMALFV